MDRGSLRYSLGRESTSQQLRLVLLRCCIDKPLFRVQY